MKNKSIPPYPYNLLGDIFDVPYGEILNEDQKHGIKYAISTLSEREQRYIICYYRDGMTYDEMSKVYDITRERIRQIVRRGISKLRHYENKNYILRGYEIVSGQLRREMEERRQAEIERLQSEYDAKIEELQKRISDAQKIKDGRLSYNEVLDIVDRNTIPLENLDLSVRTFYCLKRSGIKNVLQISNCTEDELKSIRNLGKKSIWEIIKCLENLGIKLKERN